MDLLQMRYVTTIAELNNMTRAAEVLHVSQSALSLSCKRLEEELGVKLFVRDGRHLSLTPTGELFCKRAAEILRLSGEMKLELEKYRGRHRTLLFGSEVIDFSNELITLYRQFEPELDIQAENTAKHGIASKLRSGEYSFALTLEAFTEDDMKSTLLVDEPMLVLMGASSHLCGLTALEMSHLEGAALVTTSEEYRIGLLMRSYFTDTGTPMGKVHLVGDSDSIVVKVYNNFGISFVPETVVNLWSRTPELCIHGVRWSSIRESLCRRKIYLTRLRHETPDAARDEFLHFLVGYSAAVREKHVYPTRKEVLPFL